MWGQQQYQPPQQGYAPPTGGYGGAPSSQGGGGGYGYQAPSQQYGANQSYGAPTQGYMSPPIGGPGGWQAPTPQQPMYTAPPMGQGQGPNGYAPPQQAYGGHSPQPGYHAPPPQQQPYHAPPPMQQQQQPQQMYQPPHNPTGQPLYLGVPLPPENPQSGVMGGYNPQFDADRVRKATKGFGTDENVIIDTLAPLDPTQMDAISRTYEQLVGRTLAKTLEKELSGWLEYSLVLLSRGPLLGDIHLLERACKGVGTHEDLLNEVLLCRTNEEIRIMKYMYKKVFNKDLDAVVRGELSMKTERLFNMVLAAGRDESPYVDQASVHNDVKTLYRAGQGKVGTDEIAICGILAQRSDAQLRAIAQAFPVQHKKSLSAMIQSEFSGHMREALLHIARRCEADGDGVQRDADLLEAAMAGMGTKDERLCYRLIRMHWNRPRFGAIKQTYHQRYGKTLRKRVEGETSGKYERALVAIIEQN